MLDDTVMAARMYAATRPARIRRSVAQHYYRSAWALFGFAVLAALIARVSASAGSAAFYMWWVGTAAYLIAAPWFLYYVARWTVRRWREMGPRATA